jgi:hypothetical protein
MQLRPPALITHASKDQGMAFEGNAGQDTEFCHGIAKIFDRSARPKTPPSSALPIRARRGCRPNQPGKEVLRMEALAYAVITLMYLLLTIHHGTGG